MIPLFVPPPITATFVSVFPLFSLSSYCCQNPISRRPLSFSLHYLQSALNLIFCPSNATDSLHPSLVRQVRRRDCLPLLLWVQHSGPSGSPPPKITVSASKGCIVCASKSRRTRSTAHCMRWCCIGNSNPNMAPSKPFRLHARRCHD